MRKAFISMDTGRIRADIRRMKDRLAFAGQLEIRGAARGMTLLAYDVISQAQQKLESQTRSGNLKASDQVGDVQFEASGLTLDYGFNSPYAAQRDQGGEIRPKRAKMLAIPLEPILTARGVPRYSSPREEPDLALVVLAGKVFLVKRIDRKSGRTFRFHWMLVPKVNQEGSAYFSGSVKSNAPRAAEVIGQEVRKALAEGASNG